MTPQEFKDIAEGFEAILLAIAIVIGGVWALTRFGITREAARARLDLEKLRADTQRLRGVSCDFAIWHKKNDEGRFMVYVDATLVNHGSDIRVFRCDDFPFVVHRVTVEDQELSYETIVRLRIEKASSEHMIRWPVTLVLFPETPAQLSFHYELDAPGSYMFSLILGAEDLEAKSARDKRELQKRREFYDEYRDHPQYRPDPKAELVFNKHYYFA